MSEDKNRFAVDLTEMSTERLLVPKGKYPAKLEKAVLASGEVNDKPGEFWQAFNVQFGLKDAEVAALLGQDSPKVFYNFYIQVDKESGKISTNNPDLGSVLEACGLNTKEANAMFIEAGSTASTQLEFNKLYLEKIAELLVGYDFIVNVGHKPRSKGSDENVSYVSKVTAG
jgi:hypothetical protein